MRLTNRMSLGMTVTPTILLVAVCFYGTLLWTLYISFTHSSLMPRYDFAGLDNYDRLWHTPRWYTALANMCILAVLGISVSLAFGTFLAILLDQKIRAEGLFRTAFLYPQALSFIVTGLAWRWFMSPSTGLEHAMHDLGWTSFRFGWIADRDLAIYTICFALIWHSSGLVMALMLAGLRSIDGEIWKAIRLEGIGKWRAYVSVILPMLRPMIVTNIVMMAIAVVKAYDLVLAMTAGGPGTSTDVPGKFVVDYTFGRANLGLASAAAIMMLAVVAALVGPYFYHESRRE